MRVNVGDPLGVLVSCSTLRPKLEGPTRREIKLSSIVRKEKLGQKEIFSGNVLPESVCGTFLPDFSARVFCRSFLGVDGF